MFLGPLSSLFLCLLSPGSLTPSIADILLKNSSACLSQPLPEIFSGEIAIINSPPLGGPPSLLSLAAVSKLKFSPINAPANEFFNKMSAMDGVRLPGERRHKNRLDKGPRNINEELVNKIKSLS